MDIKKIVDYTQLLDSHISNDVKILDTIITDTYSSIIYENGLVNYTDGNVSISKSFDMIDGIVIGFVKSDDGVLRIFYQHDNYLDIVKMCDGDKLTLTLPSLGQFVKKNCVCFDGYEFYCLLGDSTLVDYSSNQTYNRHGYNYIVNEYRLYKTDSSSSSYKSDSYRYFVRDELHKSLKLTALYIDNGNIITISNVNHMYMNGIQLSLSAISVGFEKSILFNLVRDGFRSSIMSKNGHESISDSNFLVYFCGCRDNLIIDNIVGLTFKPGGGFKVILNIKSPSNNDTCIIYDSDNLYDIKNPTVIPYIDEETCKINFSNDGENVVIVNNNGTIYLVEKGGILTTINDRISGFMSGTVIHDASYGDDGFLYISLKNKGYIVKNIYKGNYNIFKDLFDRYDVQDFQNDINTVASNVSFDGNKVYFSCDGYHDIEYSTLTSRKRGLFEYDSATDTLKVINIDLISDRVYSHGNYLLVEAFVGHTSTAFIVLEKNKPTTMCRRLNLNLRSNHVSISPALIPTTEAYYEVRNNHIPSLVGTIGIKTIMTNETGINIFYNAGILFEFTINRDYSNVIQPNMYAIQNNDNTRKTILCQSKDVKGFVGDFCKIGNKVFSANLLSEFTILIRRCDVDGIVRTLVIPDYKNIVNIKISDYNDNLIMLINNDLDNFYTFDSDLNILKNVKLDINPLLYNTNISRSVSKSNVIVNESCISGDNSITDFGGSIVFENDKCHRSTLTFIITRGDDFIQHRTDTYVDRITNSQFNTSNPNFIGFGKEDCLIEYARINGVPHICQKYVTNNRDIVKIPFTLNIGTPPPGDDQYHLVHKWFVCENHNSIVGVIFNKVNGSIVNTVSKLIYLNNKVQFIVDAGGISLDKDILFFESGINHKTPSDNICYFYSESYGPLVGMIESGGISFLNIFDGTIHDNLGIHNTLKVAYSKRFGINNLYRYMKSAPGCIEGDRGLIFRDKIGVTPYNGLVLPGENIETTSVNVFPVDGEVGIFNYVSNISMDNSSYSISTDMGVPLLKIDHDKINFCRYLVLNIEPYDNCEDLGHFLRSLYLYIKTSLNSGGVKEIKVDLASCSIYGIDNDKFTNSKTAIIDVGDIVDDAFIIGNNITNLHVISVFDATSGIPFNCKLAITHSIIERSIFGMTPMVIDHPIILNGYNRHHNSYNELPITHINYETSGKYLKRIIDMDLTSSRLFFKLEFSMSMIHKNFKATLVEFYGFKIDALITSDGKLSLITNINNGDHIESYDINPSWNYEIISTEFLTLITSYNKDTLRYDVILKNSTGVALLNFHGAINGELVHSKTHSVSIFNKFFGIVTNISFSDDKDLDLFRFEAMGVVNSDDGKILSFIRDFDKDNLKALVGTYDGDIVSYEINRDFTKLITGQLNKIKYFGIGYGDIGYSENTRFKLLTIKRGDSFVNEFERIKKEAIPRVSTSIITLCGTENEPLVSCEGIPVVDSGKLVY